MRPDVCAIYARVEDAYALVFSEGRAMPPSFEADGTLVGVLREHRAALAVANASEAVETAFVVPKVIDGEEEG